MHSDRHPPDHLVAVPDPVAARHADAFFGAFVGSTVFVFPTPQPIFASLTPAPTAIQIGLSPVFHAVRARYALGLISAAAAFARGITKCSTDAVLVGFTSIVELTHSADKAAKGTPAVNALFIAAELTVYAVSKRRACKWRGGICVNNRLAP